MMQTNKWIVFDGKLMPADQPVVPVESRGLMYGDGVFETFRTYNGKTFLLQQHLDRLQKGIQTLGITKPSDLNKDTVKQLIHAVLDKNQLLQTNGVIRLQVWRDGKRGYHPQPDSTSHFSITASSCPDTFNPPKLTTVRQKRIPSQSVPADLKITNGINYILASQQAAAKGSDDALMQTVDGWVSETTIANIFWVQGDTVFTPGKECDLLPGITRNCIIDILRANDRWRLEEGKFALEDVLSADAVWICNSVREVLAVQSINDVEFEVDHPAIKQIQDQFKSYVQSNLKPLTG